MIKTIRIRPLDAGRYAFVAAAVLVLKVRGGGRVVTGEDEAGWLAFWRPLTVRGLSGVRLINIDAHAGLIAAIGAKVSCASGQRCRTHFTPRPT